MLSTLSLMVEKIAGGIIGLLSLLLNGIGAILFLFICYIIFCIIVTYIQVLLIDVFDINIVYAIKKLIKKYFK
jgi:hypothetical protein